MATEWKEPDICSEEFKDCRVLVVDDDATTRNYIALLLQKIGFQAVNAATPGYAVQALHKHFFTLAVIDISFPDADECGFDLVHCIREAQPECAVMIMTVDHSAETAVAAIRMHVDDYFLKPVKADELLDAVRYHILKTGSMDREMYVGETGETRLTGREQAVLRMFYKGYSYKETANMLGCGIATVQTHAKRIYKKMGVHSQAEAAHEAVRLQLIKP
ncbi:MAG: response regulator transcription factor [Mariprofundaceae bacterium]